MDRRLGSGGAAEVWAARDPVLERSVAVKILRDAELEVADRRRFDAEARLLSRLHHPGLVAVYDVGVEDGRPFMVMELVPGPTLREVMATGALPEDRVAILGAGLGAALAYAHRHHVVHRDVKPANVLLDPAGRPKLADFGIARLLDDAVRHTQTGQTVGTAAFIAPEQLEGSEVTTAADVYSLGLLLLEALTGVRAYPGPTVEAALARLTRDPDVPTFLSPAWRRLLTAMTARRPQDRPTAQQVVSELELDATRSDLPRSGVAEEDATAAGAASLAGPALRRRMTAVTLAALMLGLLVAVILLVAVGSSSGPDQRGNTTVGRPQASPTATSRTGPRSATSGSALPSGGASSAVLTAGGGAWRDA